MYQTQTILWEQIQKTLPREVNLINPKDIAEAFIINPYMVKTEPPQCLLEDDSISPDTHFGSIDIGAQVLVFLQVLGYDRWNEISSLEEVKNMTATKCKCKEMMLKELGIVN